MDSRFSVIASAMGVAVVSAYAYSLGWLKNFYYYRTFGVQLSALNLTTQDHLIESWFVLENAAFFFLLTWVVVKSNLWWAWVLLAVYFLLPILSHYSFLHVGWPIAAWLIKYRHTILKFVPFTVLIFVSLFDKPSLMRIRDLSWPFGGIALVVYVIIIMAWSISTAKHFGSFDANRALCFPQDELTRIKMHIADSSMGQIPSAEQMYLLYSNPRQYWIWDAAGFVYGKEGQVVHVVEIDRDKVGWSEMSKPAQVQPANLFF